ncbi:hypothetical protein RSSM_06081 [Rhodopirellula sallentina SM41]|uniref:Uncharacterized protein n=1 Tax=Rhodopirellula sallentina SM41 TaxID=1263870 RepID=M5U3T2_9BACT|nr:hypothetical protein RSSM_06081 [Rhodopirellula sallentina SM41]
MGSCITESPGDFRYGLELSFLIVMHHECESANDQLPRARLSLGMTSLSKHRC